MTKLKRFNRFSFRRISVSVSGIIGIEISDVMVRLAYEIQLSIVKLTYSGSNIIKGVSSYLKTNDNHRKF